MLVTESGQTAEVIATDPGVIRGTQRRDASAEAGADDHHVVVEVMAHVAGSMPTATAGIERRTL